MKLDLNEVHIWYKSTLPAEVELENAFAVLDDSEKAKANRFRFNIHRTSYVFIHAEMRRILSLYLNCPPAKILFQENENGKPSILAPFTSLQFNLSHTEDAYALCIHPENQLGIDIERISKEPKIKIAKRFFTESEYNIILNADNQQDTFYFFWAAKEAVVKAEGIKLENTMNTFSLAFKPCQEVQLKQKWLLLVESLQNDLMLACAVSPKVKRICYYSFQDEQPMLVNTNNLREKE